MSGGADAPDPLSKQAAEIFAGQLAADRVPSIRAIRAQLHIGQPRAHRLRDFLAAGAARRTERPTAHEQLAGSVAIRTELHVGHRAQWLRGYVAVHLAELSPRDSGTLSCRRELRGQDAGNHRIYTVRPLAPLGGGDLLRLRPRLRPRLKQTCSHPQGAGRYAGRSLCRAPCQRACRQAKPTPEP